MKKISETIVFFGSGPVAAAALELLADDFVIEAVVTKPQPAHHKAAFPVLEVAKKLGIKLLTPTNKQELSELFATKPVASKLGIVIDYGIIISQDVIDYFPLGIANSHFSLLPKWRGADPISFAILKGDEVTGVSIMLIVQKLDEGPLLAQRELAIAVDATTPSLTEELIQLSHTLLTEVLPPYIEGKLQPTPQSDEEPSYSRKLTKEDSVLDFNKPATGLEREVRAYTGWPRSRTIIGKTQVIITAASAIEGDGAVGALWRDGQELGIYCSEGILRVDSLLPAGKKEMPASAFIAGYNPTAEH